MVVFFFLNNKCEKRSAVLGVDACFVLARFITVGIFYGVLGAEPLGEGVAEDEGRSPPARG